MQKLLSNVLEDIRNGENIDFYLTILVCLCLVFAGIVGIADFTILASGILATLALLATSILSVRRAAYDVKEKLSAVENRTKIEKNSNIAPNLDRIMNAKTIDWMSITMNHSLPLYKFHISHCLGNGGQIRIIIVNPESDTPNVIAKLGHYLGDSQRVITEIQSTVALVEHWKKTIPNCKVEIRYACGQPPYRMTIIDRDLTTGYIYIRIPVAAGSKDRPTLMIKASEDKEWYQFFVEQYERFWETATPL